MKRGMTKTTGGVVFDCFASNAVMAYSVEENLNDPQDTVFVKLEKGCLWIYAADEPQKAEDWEDAAAKLRGFFADRSALAEDYELNEVLRLEFDDLSDAPPPGA